STCSLAVPGASGLSKPKPTKSSPPLTTRAACVAPPSVSVAFSMVRSVPLSHSVSVARLIFRSMSMEPLNVGSAGLTVMRAAYLVGRAASSSRSFGGDAANAVVEAEATTTSANRRVCIGESPEVAGRGYHRTQTPRSAECSRKNWFNQSELLRDAAIGFARQPLVDLRQRRLVALRLRRRVGVDLPRRARQLQRPGPLVRPCQPRDARQIERDVGDGQRAHVVVEHFVGE